MDIKVDLWESMQDTRPVILVMSTGMGVVSLFENLISMSTGCIICVICGRQADVRGELEFLQVPPQHRACFVGFTTTMHELMGVADIIVTKPGGLITSEALACGLMMVIIDPYAGQEERNAAMLLEAGAGIQVHNYNVIAFRLESIVRDRDLLNQYKQKAKLLGAPDAARDIVQIMIDEGLLPGGALSEPGSVRHSIPGSVKHNSVQGSGSVKHGGVQDQEVDFYMPRSPTSGDSPTKRRRADSNISASPLHWFETPEISHAKSRIAVPVAHKVEQGASISPV
jgi:hypothetical protein